jgi:uncharacterized protein (DUF488 family)
MASSGNTKGSRARGTRARTPRRSIRVYTIGFRQPAEQFFRLLREHGIRRVLDVRLNTDTETARFARRDDLAFFLRELVGAEYRHEPLLAPTQEMLDDLLDRGGSWTAYERAYLELVDQRGVERALDAELFAVPTALLCAESTPERCHRRLAIEYLSARWGGIEVVHL